MFEADESDGTLVRYHPEIGLLLNLDRDHKETAELEEIFRTFRSQVSGAFVTHARRPECVAIAGPEGLLFGECQDASLNRNSVSFTLEGTEFVVPFPGAHMIENALAAAVTARAAGVPLATSARALAKFAGVHRRHERIGAANGITVFDDFAHNPAKVAAALRAFQATAPDGRVVALFQPHGYGPLRFLLQDFAQSFRETLRPQDALLILPVYDAGGTADRSITSQDLARLLEGCGLQIHVPDRADAPALAASLARPGDVIASMGARDPGLPAFAQGLLAALG